MTITTANLTGLAARLKRPFEMIEAAQVDEIGVYIYIAHGRFGWHRHVDEDELFLVLSGSLSLDSEWGSLTLHVGEFTIVPKGVGHRSHAPWRSAILLMRPKLLAHAQNGQRRLFGTPGAKVLHKTSIIQAAGELLPDFSLHPLAQLGAYQLYLQRGMGVSEWYSNPDTHLLLMHQGAAILEELDTQVPLSDGEIALVPPMTTYRMVVHRACTTIHLSRSQPSPPDAI